MGVESRPPGEPPNKQSMVKIGRNDPCPCGSGKKFKRCHGGISPAPRPWTAEELVTDRAVAREIQRERQQGRGRPIIAAEFQGERFVAVRGRLYHSNRFRTFHDFLIAYVRHVFGAQWGNDELAKHPEQQHPVVRWYRAMVEHHRSHFDPLDARRGTPMSGAAAALLHLAYDLYALDHNVELQDRLLHRLRNHVGFSGARYETYVAALFIRAGFDLVFENEEDRSTTHCEFTVTHRQTGKRFSVEAKRREGHRLRVGRLFLGALAKAAVYERIVFIDVNTRDDSSDDTVPVFMRTVLGHLRRFEQTKPSDEPRPAAYLFLTNTPWEHYLGDVPPRCSWLAEGFRIPTFKIDTSFTLREIINARQAHWPMFDLMESIRDHSTRVPSTFEGEISTYEFNPEVRPLLVGETYLVPDRAGMEHRGVLLSATVLERERLAYGVFRLETNESVICSVPLSDDEIQAWKQHPDTFFGVPEQRRTQVNDPLDLYDFFFESFNKLDKDKLLSAMGTERDLETLRTLAQSQLADLWAERMTMRAWGRRQRSTNPLQRPKRA